MTAAPLQRAVGVLTGQLPVCLTFKRGGAAGVVALLGVCGNRFSPRGALKIAAEHPSSSRSIVRGENRGIVDAHIPQHSTPPTRRC